LITKRALSRATSLARPAVLAGNREKVGNVPDGLLTVSPFVRGLLGRQADRGRQTEDRTD
jgi:hypothetical protein